MDEEGIALVLSRASVIRSKITNCIDNSSYCNIPTQTPAGTPNPEYIDDEEETESLIAIRYSLVNFEVDLSALMGLKKRQCEEKEFDEKEFYFHKLHCSLERLDEKIKEYKSRDLDFVHEVTAFASSMNINDLRSQIDHPNGYPKASVVESKSRIPFKGVGKVIGGVTKTILTIVGFIAVMHLSGFELRRKKRGTEFKVSGKAQELDNE